MEQFSGSVSPGAAGTAGAKTWVASGCLYLIALPFCAFGLFAAVRSAEGAVVGDLSGAAYAGGFATVFGGVGFCLVYAVRRGAQLVQARDRMRAASPDRPWLRREDWYAGRIPASGGAGAIVLFGCAVFCFAVSAPGVYVIPRELAKHTT
jgi:hypothetical protein